ncbi:MAG: GNAT family N-acetyltransferase [Clostridiales bacterium]|nr:GNAT family N-acetyltransferase [Clostridiales bacterium]
MNRIHFLRACWSDIILIESDGEFGLIDTGYDHDSERISAYLDSLGVKRLEWILITHFHKDHYGSLTALLKRYPVGKVYMKKFSGLNVSDGSGHKASAEFNQMELANCESMCALADSVSELAVIDERLKKVRLGAFVFRVFGASDAIRDMYEDPVSPYFGQIRFGENTNSVALYAEVNGAGIFLGADANNETLDDPRYSRANTQYAHAVGKPVDLYKVPHHGCGNIFSDETLSILQPLYSVVTNWEPTLSRRFTENRDRLLSARAGAKVLCTDRCGYVFTIGPDGQLSYDEIDSVPDITLEEIPPEEMDESHKIRLKHLSDDEMAAGEWLGLAEPDNIECGSKIHAAYFIREGSRIGAAYYTLDHKSGECLIKDFWVFRPFRSHGTGHFCFETFEADCRAAGAKAFEVEVSTEKPAVIRFWKAFGFADDGTQAGDLLRLRLA